MTIAHVVPEMSSDEQLHDIGVGACWCQPVIDDEFPRAIGPDSRVVIHRRYIDGPARDPNDDKGWSVIRVGDELPA